MPSGSRCATETLSSSTVMLENFAAVSSSRQLSLALFKCTGPKDRSSSTGAAARHRRGFQITMRSCAWRRQARPVLPRAHNQSEILSRSRPGRPSRPGLPLMDARRDQGVTYHSERTPQRHECLNWILPANERRARIEYGAVAQIIQAAVDDRYLEVISPNKHGGCCLLTPAALSHFEESCAREMNCPVARPARGDTSNTDNVFVVDVWSSELQGAVT